LKHRTSKPAHIEKKIKFAAFKGYNQVMKLPGIVDMNIGDTGKTPSRASRTHDNARTKSVLKELRCKHKPKLAFTLVSRSR
jgi:hypothetical protein